MQPLNREEVQKVECALGGKRRGLTLEST